MAWQLIYTSAPRSLEAGRSGFGTVARHRAISPLLVSAIERSSQFSRLPGTDPTRVIFSYRIIAIAGGRFHVLSSIRDAGADYTGRTNHLAHHLIADPREIAQLGAHGPSPAEVLLAMPWISSWTEPPRYLEAGDEIALATLRPQSPSSAWQRITGNAAQARLLASGEASRGAYVIQPTGTDLREIFAESLRFVPERLWQISFTTSLQPSDEPADFRWIGIEEHSPLRAQTETSGRPVLNLAAPATLPVIEAPSPASPPEPSFAQSSKPTSLQARMPTLETISSPAQSLANGKSGESIKQSADRQTSASPGQFKRWLLVGSLVIVASVTAVALLVVKPMRDRQKAQGEVAEIFADPAIGDYFPAETRRSMAEKMVPSADASQKQRATDIANASIRLVKVLRRADLAELESAATKADLSALSNSDGQLPYDLGKLRTITEDAQRLARETDELRTVPDTTKLAEIMDRRRTDISTSIPPELVPITNELRSNADRQQAAALLRMLETRLGPPEATLFSSVVNTFAQRISDPEAKKIVSKIQEKLRAPAKHELVTENLPAAIAPVGNVADTSPQIREARLVFYFFAGNETLSFPLPLGNKPLKFLLKTLGKNEEEIRPYGPDEHVFPDTRNLGPDGSYFRRVGGKLEPAGKAPQPPYRLIVRREASEVAQIIVGPPSEDESLLKAGSVDLKPEGRLVGALPELSPTQETRFVLVNSGSIDGTNAIYRLAVNSEGQCDLNPPIEAIKRQMAEKSSQAKSYAQQAEDSNAAAKTPGNVHEKAKQYAEAILKSEGMKIFSDDKSDAEAVGTFAMALADQWAPKKGEDPFIHLREAGKALADTLQNKEAALSKNKELEVLVLTLSSKYPSADRVDGFRMLRSLCQNLKAALGDFKSSEAEVQKLTAAANAASREAEGLQNLSLVQGRLPPGIYTFYAQPKNGKDIKLMTFNISQ